MSSEIKQFTKDRSAFGRGYTEVDLALVDYKMGLEELGVAKTIYDSDYLDMNGGVNPRVLIWTVLTPEMSDKGIPQDFRRGIRKLRKQLRDEVTQNGRGVDVRAVFVKSHREQALKDRLNRSGIVYRYSS